MPEYYVTSIFFCVERETHQEFKAAVIKYIDYIIGHT